MSYYAPVKERNTACAPESPCSREKGRKQLQMLWSTFFMFTNTFSPINFGTELIADTDKSTGDYQVRAIRDF